MSSPVQQSEQRILRWFFILVGIMFVGGVATGLAILPDKPISNYEIRVFGISILILFVILNVILYMVRNAVIANTTFLIRVRDALLSNGKSMKDLEHEYRSVGQRLMENTRATSGLQKELQRLNDTQGNG